MARTRATPRPVAAPPAAPPPPPDHPLDRAVRHRDRAAVPEEHRAAFDAVLLAFQRYEAGDDEAARVALQAVGLQSPFLEWKLLVRGLVAYTAADDARAIENWQRLSPARLPARLAAPLRAVVDPAYAAAQPPQLREQSQSLLAGPVAATLREVRAALGRDKPLTTAFRHAEKAATALRATHPHLVSRLANGFYRAILTHGEPDDLNRFRRVFGSPPDDPEFHRLEGLIHAESGNHEQAARHLSGYEMWLANGPPGWPPEVAQRARALVLTRLADLAADAADDPNRELRELVSGLFGAPKACAKRADPVPLWRRAAELAPDWEAPAAKLFDHFATADKVAEAEAVARRLLNHNPTALTILDALAVLLTRNGRAVEALELRAKALAANPLDKRRRTLTAYSYLAAARRQLIDVGPTAAAQTLDVGRDVCEEHTPTGYFALRSVAARTAGRKAEADGWQARAVGVPGSRLAAALFLAADAALAKLKPAEKRPADQLLAAAFAGPATPLEANHLYAAWDQYHHEGVGYRGQKTQEKKIHAAVLRSADADAPAFDFENLAQGLFHRRVGLPLQKFAQKCREKFPTNPVFPLMLAEVEFAKAGGVPQPHRVVRHLKAARELAERSSEPRHRDLLPRVQALQQRAVHPAYFDDFFREDD